MEAYKNALYHQCSAAECGSPRHNLHQLHQLLIERHLHLLDKHFLIEFQADAFHSRRVELYVPELLSSNKKLSLERSKENYGPDLFGKYLNCISFRLEITCPVSSPNPKNDDEILKRINRSVREKIRQYNRWKTDKLISPSLPYVIFIGLYGMDSVIIPLNSLMESLLDSISNIFKDTRGSPISAIIISNSCDQLCMTYGKMQLFNDMRLIHNPNALNHLPPNFIKIYQEYSLNSNLKK